MIRIAAMWVDRQHFCAKERAAFAEVYLFLRRENHFISHTTASKQPHPHAALFEHFTHCSLLGTLVMLRAAAGEVESPLC